MATNRLASRMRKTSNLTRTENDALTYRSTRNAVLDFFYLGPTSPDVMRLFNDAYAEDPALALKTAFYLRDIRGGKGRRQAFRDILSELHRNERPIFHALVPYVPEYGRWDDILEFVKDRVVQQVVYDQFVEDTNSKNGVSLLAKWMPSNNTSSEETRKLAHSWEKALNMTPRGYRKMLSDLRRRSDVVERKMSAHQWENIQYPRVPSRAMKLYRKAFERHDDERFHEFVNKAVKGEVKIQSKTLYPHEIVAEFIHGSGQDKVLEAQWNQLPNYFGDEERNVLVVVDTSESMFAPISGKTQAIDVSVGLGLYCAERNQGPFHNLVLTFNNDSHIVEITGKSLSARVHQIKELPWGMSTNIQSAFTSILHYAKGEGADPSEMPSNVVIISDMEFNTCADVTNLKEIKNQYKRAGYEMPGLTFWNVNARNKQAPATRHEKGVFLVGGFSAETIGKVLNAEATTPEQLMLEVLNSERYAFIDEIEL